MGDIIKNHINSLSFGWLSFAIEALIIILAIVVFIVVLAKNIPSKSMIMLFIANIIMIIISVLIGSKLATLVYVLSFLIISIITAVYFLPEYRNHLSKKITGKQSKEFLSTMEVKEELIDTLIKAVNHLSNRKIGAIITIEKEHTLNTLVEGAVKLDAVVTYELLETIFHPNTALHDGAVIIRGNHIKCASAFYQPSQKKDIPQHYGSRHRAAIGISEQSDAFTIVVSEETGHIATTIGGTITGNVSIESLRTSLNQHLIVR